MRQDCTQIGNETPKNPEDSTTRNSFLTVAATVTATAAMVALKRSSRQTGNPERQQSSKDIYVPRQLSNSSGRKGKAQGPRRLQASGGREVRCAVLHHELGWEGRLDLSVRRVAGHRAETAQTAEFQPHEKEVPEQDQLLRPTGGDRRTGPVARSGIVTGGGRDQG